jgi:GNAT superfamily N-acetyltransferase
MLRTASSEDLPALRGLFGEWGAVAEEKCFGDGIAGAPVCRVFERNGHIEGVAVRCGKWLRILLVAAEARGRGVGTALLHDAQGVQVIAAEPGNYLMPGVPKTSAAARRFLEARGFHPTRETWNLDAPLTHIVAEAGATRSSRADADRVLAFVEREFGRIWRFEASKAFDRELPVCFHTEEQGNITGFAVHDVNNRGLGFFGPTGVAKAQRGRGLGRTLLLASLADLRRLGYDRAVIPWTDALEFYRKSCGAEPAQRFVTYEAGPNPATPFIAFAGQQP